MSTLFFLIIALIPDPKLNKSQCLGGNVYEHYEGVNFWFKTNVKCQIKKDGGPEDYYSND